jgi:hypothetical protein
MRRFSIAFALTLTATTALAEDVSKTEDCGYQADVVAAIQQARLDRVKETNLAEAIAETNPEWPERYNNAVTVLAGAIYRVKRRDLKDVDLGEQWKTACLSQ